MTTAGTVIGCVWGAWRALADRLGADAPSYEWCETQWHAGLSRSTPASKAIPAWLEQELLDRWQNAPAEQLTLWSSA